MSRWMDVDGCIMYLTSVINPIVGVGVGGKWVMMIMRQRRRRMRCSNSDGSEMEGKQEDIREDEM